MPEYSLNGNDTITVASRLFTGFADKDYGKLTFPNETVNMKVGKGGNTVISVIPMGRLGELTLRLLLGNRDDAFINDLLQQWYFDPPSFVLFPAQVVKRSGSGTGQIRNVVYNLLGGVPAQIPEEASNADGDEEQGIAAWKIKFAYGSRQVLS